MKNCPSVVKRGNFTICKVNLVICSVFSPHICYNDGELRNFFIYSVYPPRQAKWFVWLEFFLWRWNVENAPTFIIFVKSSFVKSKTQHGKTVEGRRYIIDTFNVSKYFDNFRPTRMMLLFHNRMRVKMFFFEWGKLRRKAVKRNCFQRI